jgi:hypothetical protein
VPGVDAEPGQPLQLVGLGRRVVNLEPADAGPGVPQRAPVIAGRAGDDLPHPGVERADHDAVKERGPRPDVLAHRAG